MSPVLRCVLLSPIMFLAGCLPGVAWLPDSSGFVFVGGKGGKQVLHFDVASGKTKVILDNAKANSVWPAVSPDGKTIALAHLSGMGNGPSKLHVRLLNREGKELSTSVPITVRDKTENGPHGDPDRFTFRGLPQLFWRPQGDKILVHADMAALIFDVKTGTFKKTDWRWRGLPESAIPILFGPTPITPDGNGFVAWNGTENPFAILDWEGNRHALKPDKASAPFFKKLQEEAKDIENVGSFFFSPASVGAHWAGDIARIRWGNLDCQIDAKNKTVSAAPVQQAMIDGKPLESEVELRDAHLQFIRLGRPILMEGPFQYRVRVDVKTKTRRTLIEKADQVVIIPSPDRNLLVLRCAIPLMEGAKLTRNDYRDRILVLNNQGMVVGDWEGPMIKEPFLPLG